MDATGRLLRLFDFDAWANRRMLDVLEENPGLGKYREALNLMGHLLNTQQIWYRRTIGQSSDDLELWPEYDLDKCHTIYHLMPEKWSELLNKHSEDPDILVAYQNTKDESYESKLSDILYHVIIHGQHHRAQIATLFRESGINPPATDFIYFSRKNN
ncbi:MAG: DinB family protein [Balneolaceae bacterium]|nr:DinB family protein [Balneolaceae bacterium]